MIMNQSQPTKEIWGARDIEGRDKGVWTRIGTAFENKDGSWNLRFNYWPASADTTIQLRDRTPQPLKDPRETS